MLQAVSSCGLPGNVRHQPAPTVCVEICRALPRRDRQPATTRPLQDLAAPRRRGGDRGHLDRRAHARLGPRQDLLRRDHPAGVGDRRRPVQPRSGRNTSSPSAPAASSCCAISGCRVPGCNHDRIIEIHHIIHWIDGGATSTWNLVALVSETSPDAPPTDRLGITGNADQPDGLVFTDHRGRQLQPCGAPTPPTQLPRPTNGYTPPLMRPRRLELRRTRLARPTTRLTGLGRGARSTVRMVRLKSLASADQASYSSIRPGRTAGSTQAR